MPPRGEIRRLLPHGECPRRVVSKGNAFGRSRKSDIFSKRGGTTTPPLVFHVPYPIPYEKILKKGVWGNAPTRANSKQIGKMATLPMLAIPLP